MAYCCFRGIEPDAVNDTVMTEFKAYLDVRLLGKDPAKLCKEMAQTWNAVVKRNGFAPFHSQLRERCAVSDAPDDDLSA